MSLWNCQTELSDNQIVRGRVEGGKLRDRAVSRSNRATAPLQQINITPDIRDQYNS